MSTPETSRLTGTYTWIPVEERLPEEAADVCFAIGDIIYSENAYFTGGQFYWRGRLLVNKKAITHWCEPLKHPRELAGEHQQREDRMREQREEFARRNP